MQTESDYRKLGLPPELERALASQGFESLTPIQALAIPLLRAGHDLVGESRTGSGKTIAFAVPLLEKTQTERRELQAVILCPTRELCAQVATTVRKAGRYKKDLLVVTIVGGEPSYLQIRALSHGAQVVVGTPGRVLDLLGRGKLDFRAVHTFVLDEADRMLDMGFRDAVEEILKNAPAERQTVLFSATFPHSIASLSAGTQRDPKRVRVESEDAPAIEQFAYACPLDKRIGLLVKLWHQKGFESALVFCRMKASVDEVNEALRVAGLRADKIHGDLEQIDRDRVMARFRNGSARVLVATDVAARGLDVAGLDAVFNFDLAKDTATHVHRIGRTGRAGKTGVAISFYAPEESFRFERLQEELGYEIPKGETPRAVTARPAAQLPEWETIVLSGGRKSKVRPGDILGALTGDAGGLPGTAIGKIEIQDHVSYIAIDRAVAQRALKSLQAGKVKGRRFLAKLVQPEAN